MEDRIVVAKFLNSQGYDIEIDKDGFWMEDWRFTDHKTKEVIDLILLFIQPVKEENTRLLAAVVEMQKMLPVLDKIENYDPIFWEYATRGTGIATLNAYRLTLETALAKRNEP